MLQRYGRVALLLALVPLLAGFEPFRSANGAVESGNQKLRQGKVEEALESYEQAAKELPDSPGVHYNRGIALSRLGKLEQAREALLKGTAARDRNLKARSFYNLGNVQYKSKKYKEAVDAYIHSLQLDPGHAPAKWNLELALKRLKEEEKKKQEQQSKDKDQSDKQRKDQDEQDEQQKQQADDQRQGQDEQDQGKQKQEKQDQQKQQKQQGQRDQRDQGKQQKQRPQEQDQRRDGQRSEGERERRQPRRDEKGGRPEQRQMDAVLDALDENDKNLQRRRARMMRRGYRRPAKDW